MAFYFILYSPFYLRIKRPTRHLDLKTGDVFWRVQAAQKHRALTSNVECDVAIIGAGLTGACIAHSLARDGLGVVLLDKRPPAGGSTSASTALVLYEIDKSLSELMRSHGPKRALASYRACLSAIDTLRDVVHSGGFNCEFASKPSLYMASQIEDVAPLQKECMVRAKNGFNVEYLDAGQLRQRYGLAASGAILSRDAAEVNPVKLTHALLNASNAKVYSRVEVTKIRSRSGCVTLSTSTGNRVRASWVIVAAGYETRTRATGRLLKLRSTYVMVTKPLKRKPALPERCMLWETSRPYIYLRTTADNRIMIGGGDEPFLNARARDRLIASKTNKLHKRLQELFPSLNTEPDYRYAGVFGDSVDGLPYIGPHPSKPRVLYALCYGANGTNFAFIAADILRDQIRGKHNPNATLFSLNR